MGYADAHYNLAGLLETERKDVNGAEAAYRAAIAAEPGHTDAHSNLGTLLGQRAEQIQASGGSLEVAAALYDEVAEHYTIAVEHEAVKSCKAVARRASAQLWREHCTSGLPGNKLLGPRIGAGLGHAGAEAMEVAMDDPLMLSS